MKVMLKGNKDYNTLIEMTNYTENEKSLSIKIKKRYVKDVIKILNEGDYVYTKGKKVINIPVRN